MLGPATHSPDESLPPVLSVAVLPVGEWKIDSLEIVRSCAELDMPCTCGSVRNCRKRACGLGSTGGMGGMGCEAGPEDS